MVGFLLGVGAGRLVSWRVQVARPVGSIDRGALPAPTTAAAQARSSTAPPPGVRWKALVEDPSVPLSTRVAVRALLAQNEDLRTEVDRLRARRVRGAEEPDRRTHGFTPDELAAMVEGCEVRYDYPSTGSDDSPPEVSEDKAEKLRIDAAGRDAMVGVLREHHRWFREEVQRIYVITTGDSDGATTLATSAMIEEIQNKALPGEGGHARQRLARELAGLEKAPADPRTLPAVEQLLRVLTSYGDRVERAMAERIGVDLARRYRDARHNQSSSISSGCPD